MSHNLTSSKNINALPGNKETMEAFLSKYNSKESRKAIETAINFFFRLKITHPQRKGIFHQGFGFTDTIFNLKKRDFNNYFFFLNKSNDLTKGTKERYLRYFKRYFLFVLIQYDDKFTDKFDVFYFYMWLKETTFKFSEHGHKRAISNKNITLEFDEIERILYILKIRNFRHYLIIRVLIEAGMRPGELSKIRLERINDDGELISLEADLKLRFISGIGKTGEKAYYISKELSKLLLDYLIYNRKEIMTEHDYFFITQHKNPHRGGAIALIINKARELTGIKKKISARTFRKTINTKRKLMGCDPEDREILLNHKVSGVNFNHYVKLKYKEYLALFDKWNPYKALKL